MPFLRLTAPITINGMHLRNRMVMPAMHHSYTDNGFCTEQFREYYWRRAEGGLGLVITGSCRFDGYGSKINSMSLASDETIPGWKVFTDGIRKRGCRVAVQLYHAGRYIPKKDVPCGGDALSPSATYSPYTRETAREMTREQIQEVLNNYAAGAIRAKKAGFDAVEISGSSGYLLCQFLSPLTNLRTDEYGGCFENRCRFPLEVIRTVRAAVGPDYALFYRLSADDLVPNSNTLRDIMQYAPLAEAAGLDCFNVTGGWHESRTPQLTGEVPCGGLSFLARGIKSVVQIPVILCNRMNDPYADELALALGDADLIGLGRPSIADPDFANKVTENRPEEIRRCIACNQGCLANAFFDKPVQCLVNGLCGREHEFPSVKTTDPKNVLVVGGGPAGCEAAIRAAQRGHCVTLWEKTKQLGGQLNLVSVLPDRYEFRTLLAYYKTMLCKCSVHVAFGMIGTLENIRGYDKVILAVGGASNITQLPTKPDSVPVMTSTQVLSGNEIPGRRVVIIGGSFVGCEVARYLSREASLTADKLFYMTVYHLLPQEDISTMLATSKRTVTILEQGPKIGFGYETGTSWPVLQDLDRLGVTRFKHAFVTKIDAGGVTACVTDRAQESRQMYFPCDTVVVASGVHSDHTLQEQLHTCGVDVVAVGNAAHLGRSIDAIQSAAEIGAAL